MADGSVDRVIGTSGEGSRDWPLSMSMSLSEPIGEAVTRTRT